jgi:hypothetical protein
LQKWCELLDDDRLPVAPVRVIGFGSFFRRKIAPKDVDLILECEIDHSSTEEFLELIRRMEWDQNSAPYECLAPLICSHDSRDKYECWARLYTWNQLSPQSIVDQVELGSPVQITKKMLRGIPGIKLMEVKRPGHESLLSTEVTHVIWTSDDKDVRRRVTDIWRSPERRSHLVDEIVAFGKDIQETQSKIDRLEWWFQKCRSHLEAGRRFDNWNQLHGDADSDSQQGNGLVEDANFDNSEHAEAEVEQLEEIVEAKRREIKALKNRAEYWEVLIDQNELLLLNKVHPRIVEFFRQRGFDVYLAWAALENRRKAQIPENSMRAFLREVQLPESRVAFTKRFRRTEYLVDGLSPMH